MSKIINPGQASLAVIPTDVLRILYPYFSITDTMTALKHLNHHIYNGLNRINLPLAEFKAKRKVAQLTKEFNQRHSNNDWDSTYYVTNCIVSPNFQFIVFSYMYSCVSRNGDGSDTAYYAIYYSENNTTINNNLTHNKNNEMDANSNTKVIIKPTPVMWRKLKLPQNTFLPDKHSLVYFNSTEEDVPFWADCDGYKEGYSKFEFVPNEPATLFATDVRNKEIRKVDCTTLIKY